MRVVLSLHADRSGLDFQRLLLHCAWGWEWSLGLPTVGTCSSPFLPLFINQPFKAGLKFGQVLRRHLQFFRRVSVLIGKEELVV